MAVEMRYIKAIDQTLILKEVSARMWACHWAGRPSTADVKAAMQSGEVLFRPYNTVTGEYVLIAGSGRRFKS